MSVDADEREDPEIENIERVEEELARHHLAFWRFLFRTGIVLNKGLIWGVFFFVLWLLRDFFPLIFMTFVFSFVATSATRALGRLMPKASWRGRVTIVFAAFLLIGTVVLNLTVPRVKEGAFQLSGMVRELPSKWESQIDPWLFEHASFYRRLTTRERPADGREPAYPSFMERARFGEVENRKVPVADLPEDADTPKDANPGDGAQPIEGADAATDEVETISERISLWENEDIGVFLHDLQTEVLTRLPLLVSGVVTGATTLVSLLFLSTLFSFLILLDFGTLSKEVKKLDETKLSEFYQETISSIVEFGAVLGKVLEAQAVIAFLNTSLTAIGLWALGIPNIAILSLFVFVCGFVPVAGVFISSVPICLVGLYVHGVPMMLVLVAFIILIHTIEAYILNPRIMGKALHINPVLVLVILVIGHHALGVWGFLLGLPICYYFFTRVIKRERTEIGLRAKFKRKPGKRARAESA